MTDAKTAKLYRMVMQDHTCPYGIKSKWLLEKHGYSVEDHPLTTREATDAFIDRRIENVMQFEKTKAQLRGSKTFGPLMRGIGQALSGVRAPHREPASDLPGYWAPEGQTKQ